MYNYYFYVLNKDKDKVSHIYFTIIAPIGVEGVKISLKYT